MNQVETWKSLNTVAHLWSPDRYREELLEIGYEILHIQPYASSRFMRFFDVLRWLSNPLPRIGIPTGISLGQFVLYLIWHQRLLKKTVVEFEKRVFETEILKELERIASRREAGYSCALIVAEKPGGACSPG